MNCGVETTFSEDIPSLLDFHRTCFDFIVTPMVHPAFRPSLGRGSFLPVTGSDVTTLVETWRELVVGKISPWIDLDSEDETLQMDSEITLKNEIAWATHLALTAILLPTPKGTSCANYARFVNKMLRGQTDIEVLLRIPLVKSDGNSKDANTEDLKDSWEIWNTFRLLCGHDSKLFVALNILEELPSESSRERWFGEPVRAIILSTECFTTAAKGRAYLPKRYEDMLIRFFEQNLQVVVSGTRAVNINDDRYALRADGTRDHPLMSHSEYVIKLYQKAKSTSEEERPGFGFKYFLERLQPLTNIKDVSSYEITEAAQAKYDRYKCAIHKALKDRVPNEKASELTTVVIVVGAGRGRLVLSILNAAKEAGRLIKVYALETDPNAIITLNTAALKFRWGDSVKIISSESSLLGVPKDADILVTETLGSFGDNEFCPERLDTAQTFLKEDGIVIPSSYTSFIQPVSAAFFHRTIVDANKDVFNFDIPYLAKYHSFARLAPCQPVFTFTHPNLPRTPNQRYKMLRFTIPTATGSALVHGFVGYFEATLYKDVHISTEPTKATPRMNSWSPIFFPLKTPVVVHPESPLDAHFWRCCGYVKVWYEWSVTSPTTLPIHNPNGRKYSFGS